MGSVTERRGNPRTDNRPMIGWTRIQRPSRSDSISGPHCTSTVPRTVVQTWHRPRSQLPAKVAACMHKCSRGFVYAYYDDDACEKYLGAHYSPRHLEVFRRLKCGAHKADFFRYCYLYREGGVYMDIDLEPLETLDSILAGVRAGTLVTCLEVSGQGIFQAFIATPPGHPVFKELIDEFFTRLVRTNSHPYNHFTTHMGQVLRRRKGALLRGGAQSLLDGSGLYLMKELRRRGRNVPLHENFVVMGDRTVFRSRYEGYEGSERAAGTSRFT